MCDLTKKEIQVLLDGQRKVALDLIKVIQTNQGYIEKTDNKEYIDKYFREIECARVQRGKTHILIVKLRRLQAKAEE